MYIEAVPNRNSPPAILLRESYRVGGKVKKRTLLNLSDWPSDLVEGLRALLKGGTVLPPGQEAISIKRSLPHGHVAVVLGTLRRIGLDHLLGPAGNRCRDLVVAMIVARLIAPVSKLATAKALDPATAASSLGTVLGLGEVDEDELYTALDWLLERQPQIEAALARRHLENGTLVLYDVSSSYLEGRCCELAQRGYNRDGKRGKLQIVYGLLCAPDGCPIAIEVFEGSTGDPATLAPQIDKLERRFDLSHVVLVGDRGMITQARLEQDIKPAGLDWITALRAPQIRALLDADAFQLSLFDERDLASITADDYPGERLIVCRNPDLAVARRRKRADLLAATERDLAPIRNAVRRAGKPLRGKAQIGLKVGAVVGRYKMAKHFTLTITDTDFSFVRKQDAIDAEARLDGIYVVRTSLAANVLDDTASVRAYKSLAQVERAIRSIKTVDLQVRPIFHWAAPRVRAHVCLCMLTYYVEWHMRQRLAPMLYDDADKEAAEALRTSIVAKAQRSPSAIAKQTYGTTPDGLPVHSFQSLLADLATLAQNTVTTALNASYEFILHTRPTAIQQKALDLLGINPATCTQ
ncbi:MAG TPA: IS1634 family transposase [Candidatus Dormibacteraeota bacterium]|nr:IS1634 family transposase [Candidatus Dormibacteraeota bacterium]